jgi:hypothetical protein
VHRSVSITEIGSYQGFALPIRELGRRENVKPTLLNKLVKVGDLDSFVLGSRYRYVPLESWRAYIERCRRNESRDPVEKAAAARAYRESCKLRGGQAAARARSGWTDPGKAPARRQAVSNPAGSRKRASPPSPAAEAPKTKPTSRRSSRRETSANA